MRLDVIRELERLAASYLELGNEYQANLYKQEASLLRSQAQ